MAKVLVIGGGGREHAIVDALSRSSKVEKIYSFTPKIHHNKTLVRVFN